MEAAAAYIAEIDMLQGKAGKPTVSTRPARRRFVPQRNLYTSMRSHVDMGWKDDRMQFPKVSSRIGPEYQVDKLPLPNDAVTALEPDDSDNSCCYEQIWDPSMAAISGKLNLVHLTVPHNKKEAGMVALHKNNYSLPGFYEALNKITPLDGSDWTQEERELFHLLTLDSRKDLYTVSKKMGKSINNCMTYYLGKYKHSDYYRFTKEICVQERADKKSRGNAEACAVCKEGGNLLICDTCECGFHLNCVRPPLPNIPEGSWDCDDCLNMKLLEMRSILLKETAVLQRGSDGKETGNAHANNKIENSSIKLNDEYGNNKENCAEAPDGAKAAEVSKNETTSTFTDEDDDEKDDVLSLKCQHEATRKFAETFRIFFQNNNVV
mmetsp:Transcript_28711/g.43048  ORF Transcript_28711/g.43048 Transcript_28711/m.43048 type:complete len:379 (+) Transcript_28711:768-1904(+)